MKKSLLTIALLAAFGAHSAVIGPDNVATANQGQQQGQGQAQGQAQGQLQGQAQGQVANGGAALAGAAAGAIAGAASKSSSTTGASNSTSSANAAPVNASSSNTLAPTTTLTVNEATIPTRVENVQSGTAALRTTPDVYAPTMGTTAICVIGVSAGGSGLGWGFAVGSGIKDEGCEVRALSQLLPADVAKELLCAHDPRVAEAYKRVGKPCATVAPVEVKKAAAASGDLIAQYRN
jgi:hypothetical protein